MTLPSSFLGVHMFIFRLDVRYAVDYYWTESTYYFDKLPTPQEAIDSIKNQQVNDIIVSFGIPELTSPHYANQCNANDCVSITCVEVLKVPRLEIFWNDYWSPDTVQGVPNKSVSFYYLINKNTNDLYRVSIHGCREHLHRFLFLDNAKSAAEDDFRVRYAENKK